MQIKKQQLELDMEQQTGSKSGMEYIKAASCHPAYLTYPYLFQVLVLEGLVGLHRTVQIQLLQHYWLEHRLGLL